MSRPGRSAHQHADEIELRLFYANVGQTMDMWGANNALQHHALFARTVEMLVLDFKADVLWLCEAGHHSNSPAGSQLTPKQVLEQRPLLNAVADVVNGLGPYLILVRKKRGIEQISFPELHTFSVSGGRAD